MGEVARAFVGGDLPPEAELLAFLRARWRPGDQLLIQPELPPKHWKRFGEFPLVADQPPPGSAAGRGGRIIVASYLGAPSLDTTAWRVEARGDEERIGHWRVRVYGSTTNASPRLDLRRLIPRLALKVTDAGRPLAVRPFNGESFVGPRDEWLVRRRILPLKGKSEYVWTIRLARGRELRLAFPPTARAKKLAIRLGFSDKIIAKRRTGAARVEIWLDGRWIRNVEPWNRVGFWSHVIPLPKGPAMQRLEIRVKEIRVDKPLALVLQTALEY
ncbi:MAG: hypothetical protein KC609_17860 [Myxococcales bacterium]|nr:hypothetical protein [Myxococcales bacterium]